MLSPTRPLACLALAALSAGLTHAQLQGVVNEDGLISVSVDAEGNNSTFGGNLEILKPNASATVRSAYLAAASNFFYTIADGDILLEGVPVAWDLSVTNNAGANADFYNNVFAEVTDLVAGPIDAAAPGIVHISVEEGILATTNIDGTVLAVIFDDPEVSSASGVILLFGGQDTAGEQFLISLAEPLDLSDPATTATMGLGISFSFQGAFGTDMISEIDVNGSRMTSSAGGEDDGMPGDGSLITMGGVGDDPSNPADPFAGSTSTDTDDELYTLLPFVTSGDTQIVVDTFNPSDDDNIFFGFFQTSVPISVADETVFLSADAEDLLQGCEHEVTATVTDAVAMLPIVGRPVVFTVTAGPNAGVVGSAVTDAAGEATFSYLGLSGPGTDSIVASMVDTNGMIVDSNTVTAMWTAGIGLRYCSPNSPNSTGQAATLTVTGSLAAADDDLSLHVCGVPNGESGYFLWSLNPAAIDLISLGISDGLLCLGSGKGRFSGANGNQGMLLTHAGQSASLPGIDTTNMPQSSAPPLAIFAGLDGYFQYWFRDSAGTVGNNFSDAVHVTWE